MDHVHAECGRSKPAESGGKPLCFGRFHVPECSEYSSGIEDAEGCEIPLEVGVHSTQLSGEDPGAEEVHAESGQAQDVDPYSLFSGERMPVEPPAYEDKEHVAADGLDGQGKVPFDAAELSGEGQQ